MGDLIPKPELTHQNVICIGSYSMRHTAKACNWYPGVLDLFEQDFEQQFVRWGEHMLNAGATVCRFKDEVFINYVQDRINEWMPNETFVIHVCNTEKGIKIVEINTLNASGFYAADVQKLVMPLNDAYSV